MTGGHPGRSSFGGAPYGPDDLAFRLPNGGPGPSPLGLDDVDADLVVLVFHRDFLAHRCRAQAEEIAERYDEFRGRNAGVVAVLPEPVERAEQWTGTFGVPHPVLADPDSALADRFGQRVAFGPLGRIHDLVGRMPLYVIVDRRHGGPEALTAWSGRYPNDRPSVDDLLAEVDKFR